MVSDVISKTILREVRTWRRRAMQAPIGGDECDRDATRSELFTNSGNQIFDLSLLVLPWRIDPTSADNLRLSVWRWRSAHQT
jgi:hypothetical protein